MALVPRSASKETAEDWVRVRKAQPLDRLMPASVRWIANLPVEFRPVALAAKYPRIVNLIAWQWHDHKACCAYLDELLAGRRPGRRGFPTEISWELWTIR
jgi:hypothetical protein